MTSSGTVKLKRIFTMLDNCAKGHTRKPGKHHIIVKYKAETFWALPKGGHGEKNPEIEIGHIRKLIRYLKIDNECAESYLPILSK